MVMATLHDGTVIHFPVKEIDTYYPDFRLGGTVIRLKHRRVWRVKEDYADIDDQLRT